MPEGNGTRGGKTPPNQDSSQEKRVSRVQQSIDQWKKHLLDLTRRSRLVYFRPSRTSTVQITRPGQIEIFVSLVENERQLSFPKPKGMHRRSDEQESTDQPPEGEQDAIPGDLETASTVVELQSQLYRLRRYWKMWQEEQGIHVLYLTLGVLHWKEVEMSDEECQAPLILIPVGLERESIDKPYYLVPVDEDVLLNPALAFKLENDFGITLQGLSEEPTSKDVSDFMNSLRKTISDLGWSVSDEMWLTRLSFEKVAMYRDLGDQVVEAASHQVVAALAHAGTMPRAEDIPGLEDLDNSVSPTEVFPILDADSSQLEVLVRTRAGQNIIVFGPPGTGKSQTIVNLIGQCLRDNKKILFVSEKMAALEVVYRRLKAKGLDFACLELHSHKTNKSRVIAELARTLTEYQNVKVPRDAKEDFMILQQRQATLNSYVRELHKPRGGLGYSAYKAHGELARYSSVVELDFEIPKTPITETALDELDSWRLAVKNISSEASVWNNYANEPWKGTEIDLDKYSFEAKNRIVTMAMNTLKTINELEVVLKLVCSILGTAEPRSLERSIGFLKLLDVIGDARPIEAAWLRLNKESLRARKVQMEELKKHSANLHQSLKDRSKYLKQDFGTFKGIVELQSRYEKEHSSFLRIFKSNYRKDKTLIRQYWISKKFNYKTCRIALNAAVNVLRSRKWIEVNKQKHQDAFGRFYKGSQSDWNAISAGYDWCLRIGEALAESEVPENLVQLSPDSVNLQKVAINAHLNLEPVLRRIEELLSSMKEFLTGYTIEGGLFESASFETLKLWLDAKKNPLDLENWVAFQMAREECEKKGLKDFVEVALGANIQAVKLEAAFNRRFWTTWISVVQENSPTLRSFRGTSHESIIEDYQRLDRSLMDTTAEMIIQEVERRQPKRTSTGAKESQLGILLREIQKKKRHRSLRRLFSETTDLLQELKPCLLMSPLSVATYLPKGTAHFDVVIFDEASQVRPEDAIGAILRGDQLIVVGDNRQLPPTDFFQVDLDVEDEDVIDDEASLESILDECAATPGFQHAHLNWHYRSKHEELIAFSNRKFYDNKLVTFPSPEIQGTSGAVRFVRVENGVYDRGGSRTNRIEARATAKLVANHLRENGGQNSIGVITLSIAQEEALVQEWERLLQEQPDLEALSGASNPDEPMFVKSLEKVQGDERDYIFLSLGYGPDQNGIVNLNFGPVNRAGGERRLNVAVTRAREQTTVISSMLPHQLELARLTTGNIGVSSLKEYMEYAYSGGKFQESVSSTGTPESEFEIWVKGALESRGYVVDSQIGFSGFRIDLGVRHPDMPTRYILGIECDGATYHSHRTARERDRLRQQVLERLGWEIHRVWSTDWIRDANGCLESMVSRIDDLREMGIMGVARPPPSSTSPNMREIPKSERPQDYSSNMMKAFSSVSERDYGMPKYQFYSPDGKKHSASTSIDFIIRRIDALKARSLSEKVKRERRASQMAYGNYRNYSRYQQINDRGHERQMEIERELISLDEKLNEFCATIEQIVRKEAPIHVNALCRRISEVFVTEDDQKAMTIRGKTLLRALEGNSRFLVKDDFLYLSCEQPHAIQPRVPSNGSAIRSIEEVEIGELAAAAKWIAEAEFGLPKDELVRLIARAMGYGRTGSSVYDRIEKGVLFALNQGMIENKGGQISVPRCG